MNPNEPPEQPTGPTSPPSTGKTSEIPASQELARAVQSDDFKHFLENVSIAVVISRTLENEQRIVYANRAFESMTGLSSAQIEGSSWSILDVFTHEDDANLTLAQAVVTGEDFLGTFRRSTGEGPPLLAQAYAGVIEGEESTDRYRIAALVDVTDRERSQREDFERKIREKDLLLKELQHRVKNNLQLVTALIRLEARAAQRGDKVDLDRLAGRIDALALLYQTMSTDHWGPEIDLGAYISGIAAAAARAYTAEGIEIDLKVTYCPVSVNVAMPAGLLINELLTNAFRHAFTGRDRGTIAVECHCEDERRCRLVFSDDGVGFPRGASWPTRGKLGHLILQTLRENTIQLDFRLESAPGEGTRVTIEFGHQPASHKIN